MKKKVAKKIVLTKETLRTLSNDATQMVAGGGTLTTGVNTCNASCATNESCRTCDTNCLACATANSGCC
jgi:hypothetical protein